MKKILAVLVLLIVFFVSCGDDPVIDPPVDEDMVTLTFILGSDIIDEYDVKKGSIIDKKFENPDYVFSGWYDEGLKNSLENTPINEDTYVYAKAYKKGTVFQIQYSLNEEADFPLFSKYPREYKCGEVTPLVDPERPLNYEFGGWLLKGQKITEIPADITGNIILEDSWIDHNNYPTINYHVDGEYTWSSEPSTTYLEGKLYHLPYPIKTGYYFKGWYLEEDYQTRIIDIPETQTGEVDVYAKFELKTKDNTYVSFMGDSITTYAGYLPEGAGVYYPGFCKMPVEEQWFMRVVNGMGYHLLINNSWSGSKMTSMIVQGDYKAPAADSDERVQGLSTSEHDPDILIVHMGTNDYSQGVDVKNFEMHTIRFLEKVRYLYDDVEIYFCLHPFNGYEARVQPSREAYNKSILELSTKPEGNYRILDLTKAWDETNFRPHINSNAHPNSKGFEAMANVIIPILEKYEKEEFISKKGDIKSWMFARKMMVGLK